MTVADLVREALQAGLRLFPWPTRAGLRVVGSPGRHSPVLVTGNYDLTVRRVLRAMAGRDAWLVVAPSGGINVWCASSGGHLGTHQVVTALKTSGIAERVDHRDVVLPQLSATGVLALDVFRRCGWRVRFGPAHCEDLPRYLDADGQKDDRMRAVRFGPRERLEMAAAWGVPGALILGGATSLAKPGWALPFAAGVVALALAVFLAYDRLPAPRRTWLMVGASALAALATGLAGGSAGAIAAAAVGAVGVSLLLTFDYSGSTPLEGGSHFEERRWHITLDTERCAGVFRCWEVCPEACFEKDEPARKVLLAHDERCIRCGACVAQCPKDALAFETADGERIDPETTRRYRLNLMGQRRKPAEGGSAAASSGAPPP